ncbi:hypothetical protein MET9862_02049 [Methylobacterium symbioticum]|uniref:Uncharacterized protein n=1 Tax=Methylobacterium symbioticum TaxID=2584084 RepID=A0A509EB57_9HYPH|nr:hypothetical protein MET9862_02049 [Methylobacterium symbioticum]
MRHLRPLSHTFATSAGFQGSVARFTIPTRRSLRWDRISASAEGISASFKRAFTASRECPRAHPVAARIADRDGRRQDRRDGWTIGDRACAGAGPEGSG